jgi:hypothetical protein
MITEKEAFDQLQRMSGLDFFPKGKDQAAALRELRLALEEAATVEIVRAVVDDVMAYATEAPKPAHLRRAIYDSNNRTEKTVRDCDLCGGSGNEIIYELVTHFGHSFAIRKREVMPDMNDEKARALSATLPWVDGPGPGDNQQIVTSAKPCQCRRVSA